jgi:hypothetical protein
MRGSVAVLLSTVCGLSLSGCGEAVIRTGLPAGEVARDYRERWHESFFFGTVDGRAPRLDAICPGGWAELRLEASFLQAVLSWGTLGIYTPTSVTLVCAAPRGVYIGAPSELPLSPPCR